MSEWDPIGVSDTPDAADEYDAYMGGIYELLQGGASQSGISDHLRKIEIDRMEMTDADGLPLFPASRRDAVASALDRAGRVSKSLV
jgi:hypothetical protein